ncbi:MAG: hypothetical protein M5U19_18370 [Microthrixaceae bacterium]|nr:hypothetical protein [Microthrixaceae bacterium]
MGAHRRRRGSAIDPRGRLRGLHGVIRWRRDGPIPRWPRWSLIPSGTAGHSPTDSPTGPRARGGVHRRCRIRRAPHRHRRPAPMGSHGGASRCGWLGRPRGGHQVLRSGTGIARDDRPGRARGTRGDAWAAHREHRRVGFCGAA